MSALDMVRIPDYGITPFTCIDPYTEVPDGQVEWINAAPKLTEIHSRRHISTSETEQDYFLLLSSVGAKNVRKYRM